MQPQPPCPKHNLPQQTLCTGQQCPHRLGCQLCIQKHDHKFYLDPKHTKKSLQKIQQQIQDKLIHLEKYTKSNLHNLYLDAYRNKISKFYQDQALYVRNKVQEELFNVGVWLEKMEAAIRVAMEQSQQLIMKNWEKYNQTVQQQMGEVEEYQKLATHFKDGDWTVPQFVQRGVGFLYSEDLFFRFNRNLDALKLEIAHFKREDRKLMDWIQDRRSQFLKLQICPHTRFQALLSSFTPLPIIPPYIPTTPASPQLPPARCCHRPKKNQYQFTHRQPSNHSTISTN